MKKKMISIMMIGLFSSIYGNDTNLIQNPSFEHGNTNWVFTDSNVFVDHSVGRTGSSSLKLINNGMNRNAFQEKIGGIQPGVEYEYNVWVKGTEVAGPGIGDKPLGVFRWRDANGARIDLGSQKSERYVWAPYGTYNWRLLKMYFEAPDNAAMFDVGFRSWTKCMSGVTHWDDVSLIPRDFSHRGNYIMTYQAEDASTKNSGSVQKDEAGFTGTGFFEPALQEGVYIEWNNIDGGNSGGIRVLSFRYSLEGWEKDWEIFVNEVNLGKVRPTATGMINSWATFDKKVTLNPGNNVVRLDLPKYDSKIYLIDKLDLYYSQDLVNSSSGSAIQRNHLDKDNVLMLYPNPAEKNISVKLDNACPGIYQIRIVGINGTVFISEESNNSSDQMFWQMNTKSLLSGYYQIQIKAPDGNVYAKQFLKM